MEISPIPTKEELSMLRLIVPDYFDITLEGRTLVLTFNGLTGHEPLVRFVLSPTAPDGNLSGTKAAEIIEDLAATLVTSYRAIAPSAAPSDERIDDIVNGTVEAVVQRTGEEQITITPELITMHEKDWFSA